MAESDSETSSYGDTASNHAQNELEDEEGDIFQPGMLAYQGEPLADAADENDEEGENEEIEDPDGLAPAILEARFEKIVQVNEWSVTNFINIKLLHWMHSKMCVGRLVSGG